MTEKEIFIKSCGVDEAGASKSIIQIASKFLNVSEDTEEEMRTLTLDGALVNIFKSMRFTMIDLGFVSGTDYDFVQAVQLLSDFSTIENSIEDNAERIPCLQLTLMPKELEGEYYVCGIHGTWCVMPSEPGKAADMVRFIFDNDCVHTFRINEGALEAEAIDETLARHKQFGTNIDDIDVG